MILNLQRYFQSVHGGKWFNSTGMSSILETSQDDINVKYGTERPPLSHRQSTPSKTGQGKTFKAPTTSYNSRKKLNMPSTKQSSGINEALMKEIESLKTQFAKIRDAKVR